MTLMIALVGGQPLPNLLPAQHYRPDTVLLVYTPTTEPVYKNLHAALQKEAKVYGLKTNAYEILAIVKDINEILDTSELVSQPMTFNITGGTKIMSIAAYQVAQQRKAPVLYMESEGKRNRVYLYSWEDQQLRATTDVLLPAHLQLRDLFNVQFGINKWTEDGAGRKEGSPFEIALAKALHEHGYETMLGVHAMNGQIDIDVAIRFENQLGILEAKTGNKGRSLEGIKQLSNAVRHLGTFTKTFYAINVDPEPAHDAIKEAAHIQVISLPDYDLGSDTLSQESTKTLLFIVDKAMKGQAKE